MNEFEEESMSEGSSVEDDSDAEVKIVKNYNFTSLLHLLKIN